MIFAKANRGKLIGAFVLAVGLVGPHANAWSLFNRKARCEAIHQIDSRQFVLELNLENQNFLKLQDYSEGTYSEYRKISRSQIKKLDATLNALNPRRKYTEKEKYDWSKEVIERVSGLVGENSSLRQRAQMEFLRKGLDQYLRDSASKFSLTSQAIYGYNRLMEIAFDNWVTRWAAVPVLFPQLRYKDLQPGLLKKVLFEGYDKNENEIMAALKESNRVTAYNKFTVLYRKFLIVSALVLAPVAGGYLSERVVDDASNSIVAQTQEAQAQSTILKNVDWVPVQESIVFVHAKENLEQQLGRPLNSDEIQDLKKFLHQRES